MKHVCKRYLNESLQLQESLLTSPFPEKNVFSIAGVYILIRKRYFFPSLSENYIFSPLARRFLTPNRALFAVLIPYLAFIFPFFPFLPFSLTFSPFLSSLFHIFFFPPNNIG